MLYLSSEEVLDGWDDALGAILNKSAAARESEVALRSGNGTELLRNNVLDLLVESAGVLRLVHVVDTLVGVVVAEEELVALDTVHLLDLVDKSLHGKRARIDHNLLVVCEVLRLHLDGSHCDRVVLNALSALDFVGLDESDHRKGQVALRVLELLNVIEALSELEDLAADKSRDHGSSGGDCGNDSTSEHLGLVAIAFFDSVVAGTKVGDSVDEVDVEVLVIVLFEVSWHERLSSQACTCSLDACTQLNNDSLVVCLFNRSCLLVLLAILLFLVIKLNLDALLDVLHGRERVKDTLDILD